MTAPNCARATPVAARRVVVAALAETTTRDGAAIVVIITTTREGSREDVTSRDGLARARDRVSIDRWMDDARVHYDAWTRVWGLYREVSTRRS